EMSIKEPDLRWGVGPVEKYGVYVSSGGISRVMFSPGDSQDSNVPRATKRDGQEMHMPTHQRAVAALLAAVSVGGVLALGACSSSGSQKPSGKSRTVWSEENDPQRMAEQRKIIAGFTKSTGVHVN